MGLPLRSRQVLLPRLDEDRLVAAEVAHRPLAAADGGEGTVAAIAHRPLRAAHGGGRVAPARAEATLGLRLEPADPALRELRCRYRRALARLAALEARALESELGQPLGSLLA